MYFVMLKYRPEIGSEVIRLAHQYDSLTDATPPGGSKETAHQLKHNFPDLDVLNQQAEKRGFIFGKKTDLTNFFGEIVDLDGIMDICLPLFRR